MFEIRCIINDVNYDSILNIFEKYPVPVLMGKVASALIPDALKQDTLISLMKSCNKKILSLLQNVADRNNISLSFKDIKINKLSEDETEIKICAEHIDYESIVKAVLPWLISFLRKEAKLQFLSDLLNDEKISEKTALAIVGAIPYEMKADIMVSAAEFYNDELIKAVTDIIHKKGIDANIKALQLKKICESV